MFKGFKLYLISIFFLTINSIIIKIVFLIYNKNIFQSYSFIDLMYAIFWGIRFDLAVASIFTFIITVIFIIFEKISIKVPIYFILLSIVVITSIQISDIMYYDESKRHIGYELSDTGNDLFSLILTALYQYKYLFLFGIIYLISYLIVVKKSLFYLFNINKRDYNGFYRSNIYQTITLSIFFKIKSNLNYAIKTILLTIFTIILTVIFIRGGFQNIPQEPLSSNKIGDSLLGDLALNGAYSAIYETYSNRKLSPVFLPSIDEKILQSNIKDLYKLDTLENNISFQNSNIVVLLLESWPAVYMKSYGYKKETTPFFDSLVNRSIFPKVMVASGHRTTEGIFASMCSFQNPLGKTIAKTSLQNFKYKCLPEILKNINYETYFFQGSLKETSGTGSFAQKLGFTHSYGREDINKITLGENSWGVHDGDLYNYINSQDLKQPFMIGINTNSTHDLMMPNGKNYIFGDNSYLEKKLSVLNYADTALKEFIENFEIKYPNTIFIITADHTAGVQGTTLDNYLIPFLIYSKNIEPKKIDYYVSQRDLSPTVVDLLDLNSSLSNHFTGKSILQNSYFFADYYHNGVLGWIENNNLIEINLLNNSFDSYNFNSVSTYSKTEENSTLKNNALSFTNLSQNLLFSGKTIKFKDYK